MLINLQVEKKMLGFNVCSVEGAVLVDGLLEEIVGAQIKKELEGFITEQAKKYKLKYSLEAKE